jgi:hypothetical protein
LGASVKEHLIAATKSTYYQVRSEALNVLAKHSSDDDLFEKMSHVMADRSQDTIRVYLYALFDRDFERAVSFLNSHDRFSGKACNAIGEVFRRYGDVMDSAALISTVKRIFKHAGWLAYEAIIPLIDEPRVQLKTIFAEYLEEEEEDVESTFDLFCWVYPSIDDTWPILSKLVKEAPNERKRDLAITKIMNSFEYRSDVRDVNNRIRDLMEASIQDSSARVREVAFRFLAITSLDEKSELRKLVTRDVDGLYPFWDPKNPINEERVEFCVWKTSLSKKHIWQSYEQLAKILPLKLERG